MRVPLYNSVHRKERTKKDRPISRMFYCYKTTSQKFEIPHTASAVDQVLIAAGLITQFKTKEGLPHTALTVSYVPGAIYTQGPIALYT